MFCENTPMQKNINKMTHLKHVVSQLFDKRMSNHIDSSER